MARVVRRRTSPPYLLIVFVFLFLVATTLAILFYTRWDEAQQLEQQAQEQLKRVASSGDLDKEYVALHKTGPIPDNRRPPKGQFTGTGEETEWARSQTVVNRLDEHLVLVGEELVDPEKQPADRNPISFSLAAQRELEQAQELAKAWKAAELLQGELLDEEKRARMPVGWSGILKELTAAYEKFDDQRDVAKLLKSALEAEERESADIEEKRAATAQKLTETETKLASTQTELANAQTKVTELTTNLERVKADEARHQTELTDKGNQIQTLQTEINSSKEEITKLTQELNRLKLEKRAEKIVRKIALIGMRPDAIVTKVVPEQNLVYLDIGARHNAAVGQTFAVYSEDLAAQDEPEAKGQLRVIRVDETSSTATVTRKSDEDPIVPGDMVANLVFDAQRKYTFVVEGLYDLYGTGQATTVGRQEVILLIRKFGGTVAEEVDIAVDYVVMGEPPRMPEFMAEGTEEDRARFQREKEAFERYQRTKQKAMQIGIPILNTNRFLDLVGYTPVRTLAR